MEVSFKYPDTISLSDFLKKKREVSYNYEELNGTQSEKIKGYDNDHNTIYLGQGDLVWEKAKVSLDQWQQFPKLWTKIYDTSTPLEKGNTVVVLFKLFGLWWLNPARIIYTLDDSNSYGFAYGTLHGHVECGEECFWIDRDSEGKVYYHIKAFSKPDFWGAKLIYPIARAYQRKFVRESMNRMKTLTS